MTRFFFLYLTVAVVVSLAVLVLVWTAGPCVLRGCGGVG